MQTCIDTALKNNAETAEADAILRSCVHCGFCMATCPTYQILGSELDGPRGRIYLIKELLEGQPAGEKTRLHLDRCLNCGACERTCPSGVRYGRLLDIGRRLIEEKAPRPFFDKLFRRILLDVLPRRKRFGLFLTIGQLFRPLLPASWARKLPRQKKSELWPATHHRRRMLVLQGCVQPLTAPNTNSAAASVLDRLGISLISAEQAGCCGAINQHLTDTIMAQQRMRKNIDAWWPYVEEGVEAIVMTSSGCGLMVKEYGRALSQDARYAKKAAHISALTKDLSEILRAENLDDFKRVGKGIKVAYQSSCTLQHGQKLGGVVETILKKCGYRLTAVADKHLCCGAAGTYTLLQAQLSRELLRNKLSALKTGRPDMIATANIGCQLHLESETKIPVKHWIELLAQGA